MSKEMLVDINTRLLNIEKDNVPMEYCDTKLPNALDDELMGICEEIINLTPQQRAELADILEDGPGALLWFWGIRMTMVSVRQNSEALLVKALAAFIISAFKEGYREILSEVTLFYHSVARLSATPRALFEEACSYYPTKEFERTCKLVLGYADREPHEQRLEAMGYSASTGPSGFVYVSAFTLKAPEGWL
jgi:hypothetical protein